MAIDPKDLIPMPLNEFRLGGNFYLLEPDGTYTRVIFEQKDFEDPHGRSLIWAWMEDNKAKLFLNRNNPWGTFQR